MTTHELARRLLEMDEMTAVSFSEEGYFEICTILPSKLYLRSGINYDVPINSEQKRQSLPVFIIT